MGSDLRRPTEDYGRKIVKGPLDSDPSHLPVHWPTFLPSFFILTTPGNPHSVWTIPRWFSPCRSPTIPFLGPPTYWDLFPGKLSIFLSGPVVSLTGTYVSVGWNDQCLWRNPSKQDEVSGKGGLKTDLFVSLLPSSRTWRQWGVTFVATLE